MRIRGVYEWWLWLSCPSTAAVIFLEQHYITHNTLALRSRKCKCGVQWQNYNCIVRRILASCCLAWTIEWPHQCGLCYETNTSRIRGFLEWWLDCLANLLTLWQHCGTSMYFKSWTWNQLCNLGFLFLQIIFFAAVDYKRSSLFRRRLQTTLCEHFVESSIKNRFYKMAYVCYCGGMKEQHILAWKKSTFFHCFYSLPDEQKRRMKYGCSM